MSTLSLLSENNRKLQQRRWIN